MIRPSVKIRNILSQYFPQSENFEESDFPINIDFSVPFSDIDKKRIIVYQTNGVAPINFIGGKEQIRNFTFDVIVSSLNSDEAFNIANMIYNKLRKYKDDEYVAIYPLNDITPMGKNGKKLWLYTCSYNIEFSK